MPPEQPKQPKVEKAEKPADATGSSRCRHGPASALGRSSPAVALRLSVPIRIWMPAKKEKKKPDVSDPVGLPDFVKFATPRLVAAAAAAMRRAG